MMTFRRGTRFTVDTVPAAVVTVEADRQEDQEEVLAGVLVVAVEEEAVVAPREVGKCRIPKFFYHGINDSARNLASACRNSHGWSKV
jgi:hypothetical protein